MLIYASLVRFAKDALASLTVVELGFTSGDSKECRRNPLALDGFSEERIDGSSAAWAERILGKGRVDHFNEAVGATTLRPLYAQGPEV